VSRGGEPRSKSVGKCCSCGLVVRQGEETYDCIENLLHANCDEANKREIARWNEEVRKDRETTA
jgi:hypothetical protein